MVSLGKMFGVTLELGGTAKKAGIKKIENGL